MPLAVVLALLSYPGSGSWFKDQGNSPHSPQTCTLHVMVIPGFLYSALLWRPETLRCICTMQRITAAARDGHPQPRTGDLQGDGARSGLISPFWGAGGPQGGREQSPKVE